MCNLHNLRPKSESDYLIRSRAAKLRIRALTAPRTRSRWGTTEYRTSTAFRNLEARSNLGADQHDATTSWARRKYQLALSIAAPASLVAKLPDWRVYLHCAKWSGRPVASQLSFVSAAHENDRCFSISILRHTLFGIAPRHTPSKLSRQ
jgi:hypothetical protein